MLSFYLLHGDTMAQEKRAELESVYKSFLNSLTTKNADQLKKTLSSSAYMTIKNQLLSSGSKFPDGLYGAVTEMRDISKLTFRKSIVVGPTANSIYSEDDKSGDAGVCILRFVLEAGEWKFNLPDYLSSDSIRNAIKAKDFSFLSAKKYQPNGILPSIPPEIMPGDFVALIDIFSYEYEVQVTVNGNEQPVLMKGSRSGVLLGGLKKGKNEIVIKSRQLKPDEKPSTIEITIRARVSEGMKEVLSLNEASPAAIIKKEFVVN